MRKPWLTGGCRAKKKTNKQLSPQTDILSLNNIIYSSVRMPIMDAKTVSCNVRTEFLNIIYKTSGFKELNV